MEARKHRFDVNDGRTVDGFDGADPQPILDDPAHGDAMKAQRIWPVWRSPDFWGVSEISVSRKGIIQRSELTDELDAAHATERL